MEINASGLVGSNGGGGDGVKGAGLVCFDKLARVSLTLSNFSIYSGVNDLKVVV